MPMIEIDSTEYNTLKRASADLIVAEEKVTKLETTAENTKVALKTHRDTEKDLKEQISTLEWEKTTSEKEVEKKYKDFDSIKENSEKWVAHDKETSEKRTANIEAMKTKLWKDFTDDDKDIIEWMNESKVEKYLTKMLPKEEKKKADLKSSDDKGKKDWKKTNERLTELTDKKTKNLLSPTEKLEFLTLSSQPATSDDDAD